MLDPNGATMRDQPSDQHETQSDEEPETNGYQAQLTVDGSWMRHGWEDKNREEYLALLNAKFYEYFTDKRHETGGKPKPKTDLTEWRMKDRLKTVSAALIICLNLGVDPPDVIKTNPCAKLECWVDPASIAAGPKAMEMIGKNLQAQYETLSIRTRYRQYLDPSSEETKKFCCQLRRNAKDERILFHYNGHGVPKPTMSGEIWVFNKNFTQYIPISLYDLQSWLAAPSLFVYDCSDAGKIILNFNKFVAKHELDNAHLRHQDPTAHLPNYSDCIHLAATGVDQTLPTSPELPADLFTCCLTTPIEIALRFFVLQNPLPSTITLEDVEKLPGRLQERRTPMGELNWIFTAITDTIAWNVLPRSLFKKLFRQDLMVAALFRNFLLSQRIMRVHQCTPQSWPVIPDTHQHPLWQSWDLALEMVIAQLPALLDARDGRKAYEYQHSNFFAEQLTAFDIYLKQDATSQKAPDQLPIVLQVLLSQVHRLRALVLLSKFLDLGPWAVNLALSIGIFPYVLKLLQSAAAELKPVMIFIWARILAVDQTCQTDLLKDSGYQYFIQILNPAAVIPVQNLGEHRAMCAFIIATFCRGFHQGQVVCMDPAVMGGCLEHLTAAEHPLLRQWACLCISQLWLDFSDAKWLGIREMAPQRLCELAFDPVPEVRAAMLCALTTFLGIPDVTHQVAQIEETLTSSILVMINDGSTLVRDELVIFISTFVKRYEGKMLVAAYEHLMEERESLLQLRKDTSEKVPEPWTTTPNGPGNGTASSRQRLSSGTIYASVWKHVLILSVDPHPKTADRACVVVDYVLDILLKSGLGDATRSHLESIARASSGSKNLRFAATETTARVNPPIPPTPDVERHEGSLFSSLKRTASVAASLKHLAFPSTASAQISPKENMKGSLGRSPQLQRLSGPPRSRMPAEWSRPPDQNDSTSSPMSYAPAKAPRPPGYDPRDMSKAPCLPLKSDFLDWSIEYFLEPQMKTGESDEPGSKYYNQRLWRRARNEKIVTLTQPQKEHAAHHRWDQPSGFFDNGSQPTKMCFHQFEDHLAVTDDRDTVSIWDWQNHTRLNRFANANPLGSRINAVKFVNQDEQSLLMTGSSDGVIRVYRNYESREDVELVTAWRALTDMVDSNYIAGLVFDWQQGQGRALVAGDVKVIKIWNAATEVCLNEIPARSGSCITSLTSDEVAGDIFVAGFGDGAVRVYDQRSSPREAMVRVWKDHKQWITNVHMQRGGLRELVSGSRNGEVKLWDLRMDQPFRTFQATRDTLRSLSVHEHAPVFATWVTSLLF
ncbi:MAG: hypothetical protein M1817_004659 [Caeruleum heppii]|nr:MAG: hypothetical protein M1817_004659 [Caeruleum heppii]